MSPRAFISQASLIDYPNYVISSDGKVFNVVNGYYVKLVNQENRYAKTILYGTGKPLQRYIHQLVLLVFKGPRPKGLEASHINGDSFDNRLENLEYVTHAENCAMRQIHGTDKRGGAKLNYDKANEILALGLAGMKRNEIAQQYGVNLRTVQTILAKRKYFGRYLTNG